MIQRVFVFVFFASLLCFYGAFAATQEGEAVQRLFRSDSRPEELRGTEEALLHQNRLADEAGWRRMESLAVLREHVVKKLLVLIPRRTKTYRLDKVLKELRYLRPHAGAFLEDVSRQFQEKFRKRLKITSLVETAQTKTAQQRYNPSAAPSYGEKRSLHLTGAAFDISLKPLTRPERLWMRQLLVSYERSGLIDATEEVYANCFHVVVLPPKT